MNKPKLLYICINDGSDTRINKEIVSLSKKNEIFFLGIGKKTKSSFILNYVKNYNFIEGKKFSIITYLKLIKTLVSIIFKEKVINLHVVDEQLLIVILPFVFFKKITLDIFDSLFLKLNFPNEKCIFLKWLIYKPVKTIIVTDENRFTLLPIFAQKKSIIIPNVPNKKKYNLKKTDNEYITICYFGSLIKERGSEFIANLLDYNKNIKIIAAGWIYDNYTGKLFENQNIRYIGIKKQEEINSILSEEGDYLLSIYPCNNLNNIYASPNKIYDSIQTETPLIINSGVKVSEFVKIQNIGYVINNNEIIDYEELINNLFKNRKKYQFSEVLKNRYCWENYEELLLEIYK